VTIETRQKICAQRATVDRLVAIFVDRCEDVAVDSDRLAVADPLELALDESATAWLAAQPKYHSFQIEIKRHVVGHKDRLRYKASLIHQS
jgi:hypothetical protein